MPIKNWKKEILTIPNLLSLTRLLLIPVYVGAYLRSGYLLSGTLLGISCLTDWVDGWIARHFHMVSVVGKLLDPLADKLTQLAVIVCLSSRYAVLYPVLALFVVKELFQLGAVIIHCRQGKALPGALMAGKVCTAFLFVSFTALVLLPNMPVPLVNFLAFGDFAFLAFSFFQYVLAYYGRHKKILDL